MPRILNGLSPWIGFPDHRAHCGNPVDDGVWRPMQFLAENVGIEFLIGNGAVRSAGFPDEMRVKRLDTAHVGAR